MLISVRLPAKFKQYKIVVYSFLFSCPQMIPFLLSMPQAQYNLKPCREILHSLNIAFPFFISLFPLSQNRHFLSLENIKQNIFPHKIPSYAKVHDIL